jgi:outer membrane protein OmpA-like peptidoglycan-associated protein
MILFEKEEKFFHQGIFKSVIKLAIMNYLYTIQKSLLQIVLRNIGRKVVFLALLLSFAFAVPVCSYGQTSLSRRANNYYENLAYSKAAELYEKLYVENSNNPEYIQKLAYSYNKMLNYKKALYYFNLLVKTEICQPSDYYDYAQLLLNTGKVIESKDWLIKYLAKTPNDVKAQKQLDDIEKGNYSKLLGANIAIKNLDGNTRFIDMCATFYKNQVVYSSARDSFAVVKTIYDWNNQPFLDLYISKPGAEPADNDEKSVFKLVNSKFHEGPVCFTSDFNTMYFTRNNYIKGHLFSMPEGVNNLKIFISDLAGNEWGRSREFPFNSNQYSVGHPALSPDNKTLYFVSDMPGGYGETDIYKSEWVNGNWGKPVNLGPTINTSGKEMFPYVDKSGVLYFSSNGHSGYGGLDIYAAEQISTGEYKIINLGTPLNSSYDDFGLVFDTDKLSGYFTSNRPGGKGDDDNYSFKISKIELRVNTLEKITSRILPGSKVSLTNSKGIVQDTQIADKNGAVSFSVGLGENYKILAEKDNFNPEQKTITIKGSLFDYVQNEDLYLRQNASYLTIEVIDKETGLIIPNALVDVSQGKYSEADFEDNNGIVKLKLNAETDYSFFVSAEGYFEKTEKFSSKGKEIGDYTMTVELDKISAGKQFVLEDLYYDLNKYNIRPDAALVLDKLVKILADNPSVRIEIGSHTDSRSPAQYNMWLSQKRSESVVDYLVSKGIDRSRLVPKGYGESQLINKCADGVPCSEMEHQANRRTVIEILNDDIRKGKRGTKNIYYF